MPHLLELFSGTGSVGRVFAQHGWSVTSVDINQRFHPTICKDVLELTPADIGERVDLVWGSPPCTQYSIGRTTAKTPPDYEGSDKLVARVIELADALGCHYLFENPFGNLRKRPLVAGITMRTVDYCKYNEGEMHHTSRQRTNIWTSTNWSPCKPLCKWDCDYCESGEKRHLDRAQRGGSVSRGNHKLENLYMIPASLCEELVGWYDLRISVLLCLLETRQWTQSKRACLVAPEHRTRIRRGKTWSERQVTIEMLSNQICQGDMLNQLVGILPPNFPIFELDVVVTLNKNVVAHRHRDTGVIGDSLIMFLGKFGGGELCLEDGRVFYERKV